MKKMISVIAAAWVMGSVTVAQAEEKSCAVKGMHCEACITMVKEKVCTDKFEVCDVTMSGKNGKLHLKTKDAKAKIDAAELSKVLADTSYSVTSCQAGQGKG